jgi:hypothetical protein
VLANAKRAQPLGTRAFKKFQVVGVKHNATGICVFPINPNGVLKNGAHGLTQQGV